MTVQIQGISINDVRVRWTKKPPTDEVGNPLPESPEEAAARTRVYPLVGLELSEPDMYGPFRGMRKLLAKLLRTHDRETFVVPAHFSRTEFWRMGLDGGWIPGRFTMEGKWLDLPAPKVIVEDQTSGTAPEPTAGM